MHKVLGCAIQINIYKKHEVRTILFLEFISVLEPEPGAATFLVEPEPDPEPYFSLKTAPAPD